MIEAKLLKIWLIKQSSNKIEQSLKEFEWKSERKALGKWKKLDAVYKACTKKLNSNLSKVFKKFEWKVVWKLERKFAWKDFIRTCAIT